MIKNIFIYTLKSGNVWIYGNEYSDIYNVMAV